MEEPPFDLAPAAWTQPAQCRRCHYPMARGLEACPSCQRPARLLSSVAGRLLWKRLRELGATALIVVQALVIVVLGLLLAYYLSPILLLFPLVALSADPPASRGGKTVSHGRRQR